jgi:tetratricopeptide (TPR) repeat protein
MLAVALLFIAAWSFTGCSAEKRAESFRERAREYFEAGDYERARLEYLNLVRKVPQDPEAVRRLGIILQDQGASLQAAPILMKAVELEPANAELKVRLAKVYVGVGELTNALNHAWAALDLDPALEDAVLLLAEAPALSPDEYKARQERLRSYQARATNSAVYFVGNAVFALRNQDLETAQQALNQALQLNGQLAAAHFLQASIYESQTNLVEADRELKLAAELSPRRSARWIRYAEFKVRTGAPEEGKQLLEALAKDVPDYLPVVYAQAQVAFAERRWEDSLSLCTWLLERYPYHLDAVLLRSRVRILRNEATLALEELERLTRLYGRLPQYRLQLALAQVANREPNLALDTLERLVEAVPSYTEAALLLGRLNLQLGRANQAIDRLNEFLELQPNNWGAKLMLADAFIAGRQYEQALVVYREFAEAKPEDARGPFLVGLVRRQLKQCGGSVGRTRFGGGGHRFGAHPVARFGGTRSGGARGSLATRTSATGGHQLASR